MHPKIWTGLHTDGLILNSESILFVFPHLLMTLVIRVILVFGGFSMWYNCLWLLKMYKITVKKFLMVYVNVILDAKYRKMRPKAR